MARLRLPLVLAPGAGSSVRDPGAGSSDPEPVADRARVLAHPVVLLALVVWIANDHVWKADHPGWVTGKLSDVAGLIVFPLLVGVIWPGSHPWRWGQAITVAGFVLVNLAGGIAAGVETGLSVLAGPSQLTPDVTDLVVLPVCAVVPLLARRRPGARWTRAVGRGALAVGLLTTVATSRIDEGTAHVIAVEDAPNGVVVAVAPLEGGSTAPECTDVWGSADGRSWTRHVDRSNCPKRPRRPTVPDPPEAMTDVCLGDGRTCFRVAPDRIERSEDAGATWTTAWQWPSDRDRFDWRWCLLGCSYQSRGPHAIGVAELGSGPTIVAAMGHEGVLVSDDGVRWDRVAVGPTGDTSPLTGSGLLWPEHAVVAVVGTIALVVLLQIGRLPRSARRRLDDRHPIRRRHRMWLAGWATAVGAATILVGGSGFWRFSRGHIWRWEEALRFTIVSVSIILVIGVLVALLGRRASAAEARRPG